MKYWVLFGIIVFLIISIIGWYILFNSSGMQQKLSVSNPQTPARFPSIAPLSNQKPPWIANLSEKERSFFNTPAANASAEEKQAFSDLLQKNSRTSSQIRIAANCQPSPLIFSLDKTLSLNVTNTDSVNHTIIMGKNEQYNISPASSSTIKLGDDKRAIILSYGCDTFAVVGFLISAP